MFIFDWLSEDFTGTCIKRPKPSSSKHTIINLQDTVHVQMVSKHPSRLTKFKSSLKLWYPLK